MVDVIQAWSRRDTGVFARGCCCWEVILIIGRGGGGSAGACIQWLRDDVYAGGRVAGLRWCQAGWQTGRQ